MAERLPDTRPVETVADSAPLSARLQYGTPFHAELLGRLVQRRQLSERHISTRYDDWNQVNDHINFFIDLTRNAKKADKTVDTSGKEMPFQRAIVIPAAYATLMVRLTTLMTIYSARDPMIQVEGRGPEDMNTAKVIEGVLAYDLQRMKSALVLYGAMQDAEKYGLGIVQDTWDVEPGWQTKRLPLLPGALGQMQQAVMRRLGIEPTSREWTTVKEGNIWRVVDPYMYWPDPRIPGQQIQEGEFIGHRTRRAYMYLYERSTVASGDDEGLYFNIEYLRQARTSRQTSRERGLPADRDLSAMDFRGTSDEKDRGVFDIDSFQIKLIPREWKLSSERRPEIWWFTMADDCCIIRAQRSPHDHGQFTYATLSPNYDAHTAFQQGNIENMDGLQRMINWLYNSHKENVQRVLNDSLIYCPEWIEEADLLNPGPARHLRITPAAKELIEQGRLSMSSLVQPLPIIDVTRQNLAEMDKLFELVQRMLGTNDPVSGQQTQDKRTLGEVERIIAASGRRMALTAQIYDLMAFQDLALRAIANRQQFTELEQYIKITGTLAQEQGVERMLVNRDNLQGNYDYVPISGIIPPDPSRFAEVWMQLMNAVAESPQLQQPDASGNVPNMHAMFKEVAHTLGARNVDQFFMQVAPVQPTVQPDGAVQQAVQAGNMIPANQADIGANGHVQGAGIQGPMVAVNGQVS